jgi:hypothetical protein
MSTDNKVRRSIAEIIHDEMIMQERIANVLKDGPHTIPEIAEILGFPRYEVLIWLSAMRRYGQVEAVGKPNVDGYYHYALVKQAG